MGASHKIEETMPNSTTAEVLLPELPAPETVHSCPACSHWLPDGTLACPDCHTLAYGRHLNALAVSAQQLEKDRRWPEARERWKAALAWLPTDAQQSVSIQQHIAQIDAHMQAEAQVSVLRAVQVEVPAQLSAVPGVVLGAVRAAVCDWVYVQHPGA
jgi:uncharacterized Zn finger protein (UPF0148 family)